MKALKHKNIKALKQKIPPKNSAGFFDFRVKFYFLSLFYLTYLAIATYVTQSLGYFGILLV